ncbi:MAG: CHAT domain-containing protein [Caldilineaceae bacterium]|nr:CHAT domain-containing protein [Caldilineaceae bacterium]
MLNEYDYLGRLEAAGAAELSNLLLQPSAAEEHTLRKYLGNPLYQRLHSLALRRELSRNLRNTQQRGNVVLIPGMLGSQLTSEDRQGVREHIWLNPRHLIAGHLSRLQLDESGRSEADPAYKITATGILKRYYGELILTLAEHWNLLLFAYDWRKDVKIAAAELHAALKSFPDDEPVHLVAHSTGGLVARWFIHHYPERWNVTGKAGNQAMARLIMLGTPNYGLYSAPLALSGQLALIHWADMLDAQHDHAVFRQVVNSFPSVYQLLPAPAKLSKKLRNALYQPVSYGAIVPISAAHLAQAQRDHATLAAAETMLDPTRILYIAGDNQPTYVDIADPAGLARLAAEDDPFELFTKNHKLNQWARQAQAYASSIHQVFAISNAGDGSVAHHLGLLPKVPTLYAADSHAGLVANAGVLSALSMLLTHPLSPMDLAALGQLHGLQTTSTTTRKQASLDPAIAKSLLETSWQNDRKQLAAVVRRIHFRSDRPLDRGNFSEEEQAVRDTLVRGFLYGRNRQPDALPFTITIDPRPIRLHLHCGDLLEIHQAAMPGTTPVDAIAMGHYLGSRPHGLLHQLDQSISRYQPGTATVDPTVSLADEDLLLHQYSQRGIIRGELAQPFFLPDPRPAPAGVDRVIAIAGMGTPGRFNEPELTILVRELCWSLGRMGKKHLATVLIGAGRSNLSLPIAVSGWLRGLKHALTSAQYWLQDLTLVIHDPAKLIEVDRVLQQGINTLNDRRRLLIQYLPLTEGDKTVYQEQARLYLLQAAVSQPEEAAGEKAATRIAVTLAGNNYRFGAITNTASIPEREIHLDPQLVNQANEELVVERDPQRQVQLGQFLEKLLIPEDLRNPLYSDAPLVMMVDATTARIHWELLAQSERSGPSAPLATDQDELTNQYWGASRGFTRQLRTSFAPPPEPPPPVERILRVLVVADPAQDAPLIGAKEEGIYVADLFERFNTLYANTKNRIEVVRLFGPREATRTAVLRQLMLRSYDLLHYCGHCLYDEADPPNSGWLFSNGERLSAHEFTRVDRIPKFVFSNACETGVIRDHQPTYSGKLAPSLAEAFFARGVSNFICTAWPVDDRAARDFALTLYACLLGIGTKDGELGNPAMYQQVPPLPMYEAMRTARLAVANPTHDVRTWGAYQHYGDPYFRLLKPAAAATPATTAASQRQRTRTPQPSAAAGAPTVAGHDAAKRALVFFNGVAGVTGAIHPPVSLADLGPQVTRRAPALPPIPTILRAVQTKRGLGSNQLAAITNPGVVGWGLLYHEDEDAQVLAALEPLYQHRLQQLDNPAVIHKLTYRSGETVDAWLDRHGVHLGDIDPACVPFYLLIVGSPARIPFAFGHLLDLQYAVGRLHFATAQEYACYVESVIAYERGTVRNRKEAIFFATQDERDPVITASAEQLVKPLLEDSSGQRGGLAAHCGFASRGLWGPLATKAALTEILIPPEQSATPPAFLFTATHGAEWPLQDPRQLAAQGALVCQRADYAQPLHEQDYFAAADLTDAAQVHGLIAFFFACYGAGTPTHYRFLDEKQLLLERRAPPRLAAEPFVAALPQRLLAHPNGGALACIGHVDKVFTTSFSNRNREPRLAAFRQALTEILTGKPVGLALMDFNDRFALKSTELSSRLEAGESALSEAMIYDWLIRNDAEGYLLLGDPAVHLQVDRLQ